MKSIRVVVRRSSESRCVICHGALREQAVACAGCRATMHRDCRSELARCPTIGCAASARTAGTEAPREERPPRAMDLLDLPDISRREGGPTAFARLGPYRQLFWSGLGAAVCILFSMAFILWPILSWASYEGFFTDEGGHSMGKGPPICGMVVGYPVALGIICWGVGWLMRLPGIKREVEHLLDTTTPIPMRLTITVTGSGSDERREAVLQGGGHTLPVEPKGLHPPSWLFRLPTGTRCYVYGLPPPGPYLIELPDGRLALWHPD